MSGIHTYITQIRKDGEFLENYVHIEVPQGAIGAHRANCSNR